MDNLRLADEKARKGKTHNYGVKKHDMHREENLRKLQESLLNGTYVTSKYSIFTIHEPKERIIYRLPYYPDRIVHHAIMNVVEPIWVKQFIATTYSCIKGRGIHRCAKDVKKALLDVENTRYCLKLDIRKFYPSIDHDILKKIVGKKIGDKRLLNLLYEIIDSAEGVPIGNYLSQFFANLYLSDFDHFLKERKKVKYYFRYADDIVILGKSKEELWDLLDSIIEYISLLKLCVKDNYQVFPVDGHGIDFIGYVFYHSYTLLRKNIKQNLFRTISKYKKNALERHLSSYFGWLKYCSSKNLLERIENVTGIHFSNWVGKRTLVSSMYGKNVHIVYLQYHNKYCCAQVIYHDKPYEFITRNKKLIHKMSTSVNLKIDKYERH